MKLPLQVSAGVLIFIGLALSILGARPFAIPFWCLAPLCALFANLFRD